MKAKHILVIFLALVLLPLSLVTCNLLGGTTIDQRVAQFQSDMNTTDRSSAYQNFSSSMTDYASFRNGSSFSTAFLVPPPNYTFSIISESNTSSVIVQVSSGSVLTYSPPNCYLNLDMTEEGGNNWVIQALSVASSATGGGSGWQAVYY